MNYERDLAFNLRIRGLSEDEIVEALDEVRAHEVATGTQAREELGTAQEYAKQFPRKKRRTPGHLIMMTALVLALIYAAAALLLLPFLRIDVRDIVGPIRPWPGLVLILAGALAGFLTDYFRPVARSKAGR